MANSNRRARADEARQIVAWLKAEHGMSHGNANRVAIEALKPADAPAGDAQTEAIYSGMNASAPATA